VEIPVIAVIGAGASHASGAYARGDRPPLTRGLFGDGRPQSLLRTYTLAQAAGSAIQREMAADSTIEFEAALRRLQNDGFAHHLQMALAIPPFLQALLLEYSELLRADAFRYGVLVDEMLKLPTHVHFVSLNYDILLDNQLAAFSQLGTMADYIAESQPWSLIKPHGSVAWFVEQPVIFDPKAPPRDLTIRRAPIECEPVTNLHLSRVRGLPMSDPHGPTTRYPAIALPDGPKDELVLPTQHQEYFLEALHRAREIHLLVLGYSGLDTEILSLVTRSKCTVRRLTVVNASGESALEVFHRIQAAGIELIWADVFDGSFEQWIDDGVVRIWVQEYARRFESLTAPEDLQGRIAARRERERSGGATGPSIMEQQF
jgi:hypothetical protein